MFSNQKNNYIPLLGDKFRKNDERFVILFTNARDEPNIAEWIAHHLLLGFDKIIIFDHMSIEPIENKLKTNFNNKIQVIRKMGSGNIKENNNNLSVFEQGVQNFNSSEHARRQRMTTGESLLKSGESILMDEED